MLAEYLEGGGLGAGGRAVGVGVLTLDFGMKINLCEGSESFLASF